MHINQNYVNIIGVIFGILSLNNVRFLHTYTLFLLTMLLVKAHATKQQLYISTIYIWKLVVSYFYGARVLYTSFSLMLRYMFINLIVTDDYLITRITLLNRFVIIFLSFYFICVFSAFFLLVVPICLSNNFSIMRPLACAGVWVFFSFVIYFDFNAGSHFSKLNCCFNFKHNTYVSICNREHVYLEFMLLWVKSSHIFVQH